MKSADHPFLGARTVNREDSRRASCEDTAALHAAAAASAAAARADERRRPPRFTAGRGLDACAASRLVNWLERRVRPRLLLQCATRQNAVGAAHGGPITATTAHGLHGAAAAVAVGDARVDVGPAARRRGGGRGWRRW